MTRTATRPPPAPPEPEESNPADLTLRQWDTKLKLLVVAGAVVAMIWGAIATMNATYTLAKDFKAHEVVVEKKFSGTTAALLQLDLRDLKRQLYELEEAIEGEGGKARPNQTRRHKELLDQIEEVNRQIKGLREDAK